MITCRRELLDQTLENSVSLMSGRVLDIGGKKIKKRGRFRPPLYRVVSWEYLNSDCNTKPDYCCDATEIPLEDGMLDTVLMLEVLEYLEHPKTVLSEIYRLLSINGVCLLSVPFLHPIHGDYLFDRQRWTSVKLEEICVSVGFSEIMVQAMGSVWSVLHDILIVSTGYAHPRPGKIAIRLLRALLRRSRRACMWMDKRTMFLNNYINTGYFLVLKKCKK